MEFIETRVFTERVEKFGGATLFYRTSRPTFSLIQS